MTNTSTFEVTISLRECVELDGEGGPITAQGAEALETFAAVLEAYGLDVSAEYTTSGKRAKISIRHPEAHQAKRLRSRGGGRRAKAKPSDSPVHGMDSAETLEWLEGHSVAEGMKALGCSKRTYYRRLEALRSKGHK